MLTAAAAIPLRVVYFVRPDHAVRCRFPMSSMRSMRPLACAAMLSALSLAAAAGCGKSDTAQARAQDNAAKPVKVETVRKDDLRRAVDVVGTLAATDQVTI